MRRRLITAEPAVEQTTQYLKLERRIATGEHGGIIERWRYGRLLLDAKTGRQRLPKGMIGDLVAAAERAGLKLSEREIQYRIQCAETYQTEVDSRSAAAAMGSWRALCDAGFPPVEAPGSDPDDLQAEGLDHAPDEWEQLQLDIPGLKPSISIRGRKVELVRGERGATSPATRRVTAVRTGSPRGCGRGRCRGR